MNIVIPMAGRGARFLEAGYAVPKPLIDVNGEPMIVKAIKSLDINGTYHFVVREDEGIDRVCDTISNLLPTAKFVKINYVTEGPACSVMLFENDINNDDELIVANCDQIMWWNSEMFLRNARHQDFDGTLVTYWANTNKNSYAKLNRAGFVTEVREKTIISNVSLNGIHYWKKGKYFVQSTKLMMDANDRAPNGEFYVGPTYNYLIKNNLRVGVYHIPNEQHHAVGTPEDLEKYIKLEKEQP